MLRPHLSLRPLSTSFSLSTRVRRGAHSWSPAPAAASGLAFFDSHYAPRRRERDASELSASALSPHSRALYGQLVVSALLRPAHASASAGDPGSNAPEDPNRAPQDHDADEISDQEWEIRTGRAIYILQQTLPDYFSTGLVSSLDIPDVRADSTGSTASTSSSNWSIKAALGLSKVPDTLSTDPDPPNSDSKLAGKGKAASKSKSVDKDSTQGIYSPRIRLRYTPPTPLPAPFPKTLHIEGLHLYIASSVFLRHTLNALYTDLHIELRRVRIEGAPPPMDSTKGTSSGASPPVTSETKQRHVSREKSFVVGMTVLGVGRVSKAPAQWDVNCTYTFSPVSGLILQHSIDSIEPAPTQALFEALGKFGLLSGGSGGNRPVGGAGLGS